MADEISYNNEQWCPREKNNLHCTSAVVALTNAMQKSDYFLRRKINPLPVSKQCRTSVAPGTILTTTSPGEVELVSEGQQSQHRLWIEL